MRNAVIVSLALTALCLLPLAGAQEEPPKILYLTKSVDFEHSPVREENGAPSLSAKILSKLADQLGAEITCTKDASVINKENLANYDLVMFYTQGDLTQAGGLDNSPGMPATGVQDLVDWIKAGGGFIGFHSATDTFDTDDPEPAPYIQMIGAEFRGHGGQFAGEVTVVDPDHPTMANFPKNWTLNEEWYLFRKFNAANIRVLALMDPGAERAKQEAYNIPAYPVVWVRQLGDGRIYSTALGHREDVWANPKFQKVTLDAMEWALGKGPADAQSNFVEVVPKEIPAAESK